MTHRPPPAGQPLTILYLVVAAVRTAVTLATPALVAAAVGAAVTGGHDRSTTWWLAGALLLTGIATVASSILGAAVTGVGTARLRVDLVEHLLSRRCAASIATGDTVARVTHSASEAASATVVAGGAFVSVGGAAVAWALLWLTDWPSGLTFTVLLPLVLLGHRYVRELGTNAGRYLTVQSQLSARLMTTLGGIRTVRASGTAEQEIQRVVRPLPELHAAGRASWSAQRSLMWRLRLAIPAIEIATLAVAGTGVGTGRLGAAELLAVAGYVALALGGLDQIDSVIGLAQAAASRRRIAEILDEPLPRPGTRPLPRGGGSIVLRGVCAAGGLTAIDLDIPAGCSVAVVGSSGSGKSVLAALIGGLIRPTRGDVVIDGLPLTEARADELHAAVAYAFARPALLGSTIAETIGYPDMTIARHEIVAAARQASAHGFITKLPQGYDTPVERAPMSGGELQRIGLARAFVQARRILVLDDATSGLDAVTEAEVREVLTGDLGGRTRILVTRHPVSAQLADLVVWLEGGRIAGLGAHDDLLRDPGYEALFDTATRGLVHQ